MGKKALEAKSQRSLKVRQMPLSATERAHLASATYEGSPYHKRNPGDFGLDPPALPRPDATLCDEAGVVTRAVAHDLFSRALAGRVVSAAVAPDGRPKHLWVVDDQGRVFEARHGGGTGCYHGYPVRRADPLFSAILEAWSAS